MFIEIGSVVFVFCFAVVMVILVYMAIANLILKIYTVQLKQYQVLLMTQLSALAALAIFDKVFHLEYDMVMFLAILATSIYYPLVNVLDDYESNMLRY